MINFLLALWVLSIFLLGIGITKITTQAIDYINKNKNYENSEKINFAVREVCKKTN